MKWRGLAEFCAPPSIDLRYFRVPYLILILISPYHACFIPKTLSDETKYSSISSRILSSIDPSLIKR